MSDRRSRRIHDAVLGRVHGRAWLRMAEQLRGDPVARGIYDRASAAMRALERRPIAADEIDRVERWLIDDGVLAPKPIPARRSWAWIGLGFAVAAAMVLALRPGAPPAGDGDRFGIKGGGDARPLGLQLLCDDGHGAAAPLRDVTTGGACPLDATLSFAIRLDAGFTGGTRLAVFGVDEDGEVLYYVPVPDDPEPPTLVRGQWQPLSRAVRLAVNHRVGTMRVYAVVTPLRVDADAATLPAIDRAAAALSAMPSGKIGDPPWHERLATDTALLAGCGAPGLCASAELELRISAPGDAGPTPSEVRP